MPFLSLVHLKDLSCEECFVPLADAGARSFVVNASGDPVLFAEDDPPALMMVHLTCANGHQTALSVPGEISAEETLQTPEEAPVATDAVLIEGKTESGKALP